ncbi:MAG: hypothetical protein ACRD1B_09820 [Thermoanaerobaculia bacterium]
MQRFYLIPTGDTPQPLAFTFDGRVVRYVCAEADEPAWRLALEIFLVKTFRQTAQVPKPAHPPARNTRTRLGLRKLHPGLRRPSSDPSERQLARSSGFGRSARWRAAR